MKLTFPVSSLDGLANCANTMPRKQPKASAIINVDDEDDDEDEEEEFEPRRPRKRPIMSRKPSKSKSLDQRMQEAICKVFMMERNVPDLPANPTPTYLNAVRERDELVAKRDHDEIKYAMRPGATAIARALFERNLSTGDVLDWFDKPISTLYSADELDHMVSSAEKYVAKKRKN